MLVLTRHKDDRIYVGDDIEIIVVGIHGDQVRLGIVAPPHVVILRDDAICTDPKHAEEKETSRD